MKTADTINKQNLSRLVNEYTKDRVCLLEFLRFLARHPSTRFNQRAVLNSLDFDPDYVKNAVEYLIDKDVVVEISRAPNAYYQLTDTEPLRSELLNLSRRDWSQQNTIQTEILQLGELVYA